MSNTVGDIYLVMFIRENVVGKVFFWFICLDHVPSGTTVGKVIEPLRARTPPASHRICPK